MAITLEPYNTITLTGAPEQLVAGIGHWFIQILNNGPGSVLIAQSQAALAAPATSFTLDAQLSFTPFVWGPDGLWVEGSGSISVALIPNTGTGAPTGAGAVVGPGGGGGSQTPWTSNIDAGSFSLNNLQGIGLRGLSAPLQYLIYGSSTVSEVLNYTNTMTTSYAGITLVNGGGYGLRLRAYGASASLPSGAPNNQEIGFANVLLFTNTVNNSVIARMLLSGYLGLGVATPAYRLDASGDINITGSYRVNGAAGVSGAFTSQDGFTITVTNGIITGIA